MGEGAVKKADFLSRTLQQSTINAVAPGGKISLIVPTDSRGKKNSQGS